MKGLTTSHFAILCLALANGVPTENDWKIDVKNIESGLISKKVIHASNPFSKDVVYGICEGLTPKNCTIYQKSLNLDENIEHSCELNLDNTKLQAVRLVNAGNNKAIFIIHKTDNFDRPVEPTKFISVNLNSCNIKESSIDLVGKSTNKYQIFVVPRENDYDVVFKNTDLCGDLFCKTTFDYDGNIVKAASKFGVKHADFSQLDIKSVNKGYLVSVIQKPLKAKVSLLQDDELDGKTLLETQVADPEGYAVLSTEENKIGFCVSVREKLTCQQYDAEAKSKIDETEVTMMEEGEYRLMDVLNVEKGLLAAITKIPETNETPEDLHFFVVPIDGQGKQNKFVKVDLKCDPKAENYLAFPTLYKNSMGESCISYVCHSRQGAALKISVFSKCFDKSELV